MQKIILYLFTACLLFSCNKDTIDIEVPPFSVYPNPFVNQISIHFDTNRFPNSSTIIRILNGKEKLLISFDYNTSVGVATFLMSNHEKGIYYVEMELEGKTYNLPILKAE